MELIIQSEVSQKEKHQYSISSVQLSTVQFSRWVVSNSLRPHELQHTSPEHPVSCIKPGLMIYFTYSNVHVSMLFSQIIPPSPSPTESKKLFYTSVSLLLSHIQGYHYHLSKFHIYALVYCIGLN